MKYTAGDTAVPITLPSIDGSLFDSNTLKGKPYMLSFFRFASCPFCNLRLHELITHVEKFGDDFTIVAIFDSPLDNLTTHAKKHQAPFAILADEDNQYYRQYSIEHSILGVLKGMIFRMPTLFKGMCKGYLPIIIKGRLTTMPADFLIDSDGIIQHAYYGKDEGDHLPLAEVIRFAQQTKKNNSDAT